MRRLFPCIVFILLLVANADASYYTVKKGDSLHNIAKRFGTTTQALKEYNSLSSDKLSVGMKLRVSADAPSPTATKKKQKQTSSSDSPQVRQTEAQTTSYTVKKGDSLERIAKRHGISKKDLLALNNLPTSTKGVKVGQKLVVKKDNQTARAERPLTYTVRKGDSIYGIARKHNTTAEQLMALNGLSSPKIKKGQTLVVSQKKKDVPQRDAGTEESPVAAAETGKQAAPSAQRIAEVKALANSEDISQLSITDRLTLFAKKMLHLPYKFGGNGSVGLDCSAFVQKVYDFAGIDLPRSAREQYKVGEPVDKDELSIGDLVFFRTYASFPSHVGIYLGNNLFIHASSKSKKVTIDSLETPYYVQRYIGAKRLLPESNMN